MQVFLRILKELGIAIIFILLIVAILAFAFRDKVPFGTEVPEAVSYTAINQKDYVVADSAVEEAKSPDQIYKTSVKQLEEYITEKIVSPGRIAPFGSIDGAKDVPSEKVSDKSAIQNSSSGNSQIFTNESTLE